MAKGKPRRADPEHDFMITARRVVQQAIGEKLDGSPLDRPVVTGKVRTARRTAGMKGGARRAKA
jgi:hypothetical protein